MSKQGKSITISREIYKLLEEKIKNNNFSSIDNYVEHLLRQVLRIEHSDEIDPEEEEEIKRRLESLGYL